MNLVNPDGFFSFFFGFSLSPIDKSNLFIVWFLGADLIWGLSGGFFCDAEEDFLDCTDWVSESSFGGKNFGVSDRTAWMTSSPSPSSTSSRLLCGTEDVCFWSSTTSGSASGSTRSAYTDFEILTFENFAGLIGNLVWLACQARSTTDHVTYTNLYAQTVWKCAFF